jgi:WD40 repeat protein
VKLWNVRTLEETLTLADFLPVVLDLNFSEDGETLVAASFAGDVRVWHAPRR